MRESHPVWLAIGTALATIGGAVVAGFVVAQAMAASGVAFSLWSRGWFLFGFGVMCAGLLALAGVGVDALRIHARVSPIVSLANGADSARREELGRVARQLGSELREIRLMIERVKGTNPMSYPRPFRLPTTQWEKHEDFLAREETYDVVEKAYSAVRNTNGVLNLREARQGEKLTPLGVIVEDGLDRAHGLAGEALDALGEMHNEPFVATHSGEAHRRSAPAIDDVERLHAKVLFAQIGDDQERARKCGQLIERGHALRTEVQSATVQEMLRDMTASFTTGDLRRRLVRWCSDVRGFVDANVIGTLQDLISEARESELLETWTTNSVCELINAHLATLRQIRDSIFPERVG